MNTASEVASAPARTRLLVVDDDPLLRAVLARLLGRDHDVATAESAREALALVASGQRFDALLCDLHLAGGSGREFHATLARTIPEQATRVVFLTGDAGATRDLPGPWLLKPVDLVAIEDVLARVHRAHVAPRPLATPRDRT